jgi:hypothetical protein
MFNNTTQFTSLLFSKVLHSLMLSSVVLHRNMKLEFHWIELQQLQRKI